MLGASEQGSLDVQLAPVLDIDLDPTRQRLVLRAGSRAGVRTGQTVIDAGGVVGQIIETAPLQSTVLLLTDPDHAIPVAIARNGVRLVAYGTGSADRLALASVPLSSDVKVGDILVTSGLGGRFAAGFPVGTITALQARREPRVPRRRREACRATRPRPRRAAAAHAAAASGDRGSAARRAHAGG